MIYLIGKNADRETFITAAGFLFSVGSIPLLIGFWANGMLSLDLGMLSMLCIIPTLIGFRIGELVRHKLSAELFRKAFRKSSADSLCLTSSPILNPIKVGMMQSIESIPKSRESIPFAQKPINKGILPTLKRKPAAVINVSRSAFFPIK